MCHYRIAAMEPLGTDTEFTVDEKTGGNPRCSVTSRSQSGAMDGWMWCVDVSTGPSLSQLLCLPPLLWQSSCRVVCVRRRIATASVVLWQHAALQKALKKHIQVDSNELAVASMANSEDDLQAGARPPPTKSAPSSLQAPTRPAKRSGLGIDIPGMCTAFGCRLWHASPVRVVYVAFRSSGDDLLPQMPPASRRTR
jgi:hypothetical protein